MTGRMHGDWTIIRDSFREVVEMKFWEIGTEMKLELKMVVYQVIIKHRPNSRRFTIREKEEKHRRCVFLQRDLSMCPSVQQGSYLHNPHCYLKSVSPKTNTVTICLTITLMSTVLLMSNFYSLFKFEIHLIYNIV